MKCKIGQFMHLEKYERKALFRDQKTSFRCKQKFNCPQCRSKMMVLSLEDALLSMLTASFRKKLSEQTNQAMSQWYLW
jgi:hypothetical protein